MPVSAWPAERILPPNNTRFPGEQGAAQELPHPWILAGIKGLIEGASILVLRGCANNRRRTRGAWASAEGSHCSASAYLGRTTPSEPGDPEPRRTFVSRHSDHLIIVSKLRVGLKPLPCRDLSSQDAGRAELSRSSIRY